MSQRPINLLEIKANLHKANTEMLASFETIYADCMGKIHNLSDQVKVYQTEMEGLKAEITRLRKQAEPKVDPTIPPQVLKAVKKVEPPTKKK